MNRQGLKVAKAKGVWDEALLTSIRIAQGEGFG